MIDQLNEALDAANERLKVARETFNEKQIAFDTSRNAAVRHRESAAQLSSDLERANADLARAVVDDASEHVKAPLRNKATDLRAAIEHHRAEADRNENLRPQLEMAHGSAIRALEGAQREFEAVEFNAAREAWAQVVIANAAVARRLQTAAQRTARSLENSGLWIDLRNPSLGDKRYDIPQG